MTALFYFVIMHVTVLLRRKVKISFETLAVTKGLLIYLKHYSEVL